MSTPANLSEQVLALPAGAGNVQSPGETFTADPYSGTGRYTIPITVPAGHAGSRPTLALTYSTHGGNGIAGLGWSLGLARVSRRIDKGVPGYVDKLDLFALQGDELLPAGGGRYRLRIETRFARIRHVRSNGDDHWVVHERDGTRVRYGLEPDHRLHDDTGRISAWYVSRKQDAHGNEVLFSYVRDRSTHDVRLVSVSWAGCYRVTFEYETRPDAIVSHRHGFEHRQGHRLARIASEVRRSSDGSWQAYRTWALEYTSSALTGRSLLARVTVTGRHPDGTQASLPPLTFGYAAPDLAKARWHDVTGSLPGRSLRDRNVTLVHQTGSGLPDLLETTATGHWLRENIGGGCFAPPRRVASPALVRLDQQATFVSDLSGDGFGDLVVAGGRRAYRAREGGGWGAPYTSPHAPSVDLDAPDVRLADYDGDGVPDALRAGAGPWVYFENLGDGRWAGGRTIPTPPAVPFDSKRLHVADVTGDGLPDLVYIDRRQVLVWPGRGGGRFDAPYRLANAPDFGPEFDPAAVTLVAIAGSGHADILYRRAGTVVVCFNRSGTALSDPVIVPGVAQSARGHVEAVDLLGTGATGLLFTDEQGRPRAWRFLELFRDGATDLLTTIDNGIGARTILTYASSAAEWVRDRRAGRRWTTSMPSAQVVVQSIATTDTVTGVTSGVSYRYHDGVYDRDEREFRGFALVEQIDREAEPGDPRPLPPVVTRRWYHTGRPVTSHDQYTALPEPGLRDDVPDLRWAQRSLRGLLRRQEVFALDGDARPYTVAESAYRVFAIARTPGTERYSFAPLKIRSRVTHLERSAERRVHETSSTYDLASGSGYGLAVEHTEKALGRRGSFTTAHERQQTEDIELRTIVEYVNRDEPDDSDASAPYRPAYVVGRRSMFERYAIVAGEPRLLQRELSFYDGDAYRGLGYPGSGTASGVERGRLSARLVLALTDDLVATSYPAESGAMGALTMSGGYLRVGNEHFLHAERYAYDDRGMVIGTLDANGNESRTTYDPTYGLYSVAFVDAAGNPTAIVRGELPQQIASVLDAAGNTTSFTYDALGLVGSSAIQGKLVDGDWQGDPPTHPTHEHTYDLASVPIRLTTRTRRQRLGVMSEFVRYVDGMGRTVQHRQLAEPDPDTGAARYRVSAWQVLNHKGLVVRRYQPVFGADAAYSVGNRETAFVDFDYDPLGRPLRVTHPDGTFETTTYHPWVHTSADRNDNAAHLTAADPRYGAFLERVRTHVDTPTRQYVDALGREIAIAEDNGDAVHVRRKVRDGRGRVVEVWDARGLPHPTWRFRYDFAGRRIHAYHLTGAGERHVLADAAGNMIWTRDARGAETTRVYDVLGRPVQELSDDGHGAKLRRQWRYVDHDPEHPDFDRHQALNLVGRLEEARDHAGLQYFEYDWRGLPTRVHTRFWDARDASGRDWDDGGAQMWTEGDAWDPAIPASDRQDLAAWLHLPGLADSTTLSIVTSYDAAGRPADIEYPALFRMRYMYGAGGLLERLDIDPATGTYEPLVQNVSYNARGQLSHATVANGVETRKEYDEALQRLVRVTTQRTSPVTWYQDLAYDHDPVGNPLRITDRLSGSPLRDDRIVPNTREFEYDPRYRLVGATGIAHRTLLDRHADGVIAAPDPNDYVVYHFQFGYDAAGNFTASDEYGAGPIFYKDGLIDLFNGDTAEAAESADPAAGAFRYDANGNTVRTPRHAELAYTHDNQLRFVELDAIGQIRYFRHADRRILRLAKKSAGFALDVYLGPFEYRARTGTDTSVSAQLHVQAHGRCARLERVLAGSDSSRVARFFVHPDHLGSGHVLTGDDGSLLSQEEYFPYGRASDRRDGRERYRFIGVERDEDTSLCMTGPRTYDPVCGRFLQPDPLASVIFHCAPYVYASASPILRLDPGGYQDPSSSGDPPENKPADVTYDPGADSPSPDSNRTLDPAGNFEVGPETDRPPNAALAEHDKAMRNQQRRLTAMQELRGYVHVAGDVGLHTEAGRRFLTPDLSDPTRVGVLGKLDAHLAAGAERALHNVALLGPEAGDLGDEAIAIAEGELRNLEHAENMARRAAGLPPVSGIQTTLQVSKARQALNRAGRSFVKGVPFVGYAFTAATLEEARKLYQEGEYVGAGLTAASTVYEPIDWAWTLRGLYDFGVASWEEYQAERSSAQILADIRQLEAEAREKK